MKEQNILQGKNIFSAAVLLFVFLMLVLCLIFFLTDSSYRVKLYFPDKSKTALVYEQRTISRSFSKREKMKKIVNELLLGAIDPDLKNTFPKRAKLLSLWLEKDHIALNFNKELLNDLDWNDDAVDSSYMLLLQAIVHTICTEERSLKRVKFYFDGVQYRYIGAAGPIDEGILPDWNLLQK